MVEKLELMRSTNEYPCLWDDLLKKDQSTYATVYTLEEKRKDDLNSVPGINKGQDGVWDIVLDIKQLTLDNVANSLKNLSQITGIEYKLIG